MQRRTGWLKIYEPSADINPKPYPNLLTGLFHFIWIARPAGFSDQEQREKRRAALSAENIVIAL